MHSVANWPGWAALTAVSVGLVVLIPSPAAIVAVLVTVLTLTSGSVCQRLASYLRGTWLVLVVFAVLYTHGDLSR